MKFENNKSGNGGVLTLNNEIKEVGRLTYTIFPEDHKLIISFVWYILNLKEEEWENICGRSHQICKRK
jgi:hypothetical protein